MIKCEITENSVRMTGHADTPAGDGHVCAAASMLISTLLLRLMKLEKMEKVQRVTVEAFDDGDAAFSWDGDATETVETFLAGMWLLQNEYPEVVEVHTE